MVDNINMARREYQAAIKAGQQATPVWKQLLGGIVSWQTALVVGITLLTVYGKEITAWTKSLFGARQSLADALETLEEFQESVAKTSSTTLTQLQRMSAEWEKLGDNIQAKEQYLLKNRTAFEHLGVSIGKVTDAENLFNQGKEAFVASVMARARASAAMTLATEKYNEAIRKQLEVDRMADTQSYAIQGGQFGQTTYVSGENLSKKKAQAEADSLFDEARKVLERGLEYSEEERKSLETANLKTIHTLEQGSVEAIKASIAAKEAALDKLTNKQDYEAALKEIEAEKKKLEAIIGSTGGKVGKEPAPLGSIAYYNELIAKMKKLRDLATTNKDRSAFAEQIKEYEEKVADMENRIIISGKKIAMETLQSSLEGIKVDVKFDNRNVLEKAFGKFDTSDLDQMQEKIDKELNRPIKEAREGIVLLIDQWDRLSDADQVSLLAEECYKVADGISMAAETAELFNEALGSSLATVAQLVGSVGDMAGGIGRIMSGDLIGGASGIIGGITGIVGSFKKRVEENKKILAEYQLNLVETAMKELEYNAILRTATHPAADWRNLTRILQPSVSRTEEPSRSDRERVQTGVGEIAAGAVYHSYALQAWHLVPQGEDLERLRLARRQDLRRDGIALYAGQTDRISKSAFRTTTETEGRRRRCRRNDRRPERRDEGGFHRNEYERHRRHHPAGLCRGQTLCQGLRRRLPKDAERCSAAGGEDEGTGRTAPQMV